MKTDATEGPRDQARENGREKASDTKVQLVADFGKFYAVVRKTPGKKPVYLSTVKAEMTLYKNLGHFYEVQGKHSLSASAYVHLNKVASISILSPQQLIVDGHPVPNPMIERESKTKAITAVNIRKVGIGYSPAGNIVVVDKTLFYNVYTYLIQSIQKKMKSGSKDAIYGIASKKPDGTGSWYFLPTEGELGLWINYESAAIIDCLEEHTQRQRFGDRIAQKIVERNIYKDHPAIGVSQVYVTDSTSGPRAVVTIYGFRNENTPKDLSELVAQVESGEKTKDFELKAEVVPSVTSEEEKAELERIAEEEAQGGADAGDGTLFEKEPAK